MKRRPVLDITDIMHYLHRLMCTVHVVFSVYCKSRFIPIKYAVRVFC